MKLLIRTIQEPEREHDVTRRLVAAIAEELWRLYGGNDQLNWLEAELHLQRIVGQARADARETRVILVDRPGASGAPAADARQGPGKPGRRDRASPNRTPRNNTGRVRTRSSAPGPGGAPEQPTRTALPFAPARRGGATPPEHRSAGTAA
ncbi:MAG TPA: hypothetical protein PKE29_10490 [Phycisphaerales bacterium]|nr:hypothetical protein [Phycisphaerales bacterium]